MNHPPKHCLINQGACGREPGNPVCPKCGMDERVVYPGQVDLETALEKAELRYWKAQAKALESKLATAPQPTPAASKSKASPQATGQVFRDALWAPEMVVLPSGSFMMGSPADEAGRGPNEGPQHKVTLAYKVAIGKYPVTFDEWDACVADGGTTYKPDDKGWGRGKRPVIEVSWEDTQAYLAWLNMRLGIASDDPGCYRLPSEAEWEYACRAGTKSLYSTPGGQMSDEFANYDASYTFRGAPKAGQKEDKTTPVGMYQANPWGLNDMHGNVWEWVQDTFEESYRGAPLDGRAWETGASSRVLRGGAWYFNPQVLRSAFRGRYATDVRYSYLGFRIARTLP